MSASSDRRVSSRVEVISGARAQEPGQPGSCIGPAVWSREESHLFGVAERGPRDQTARDPARGPRRHLRGRRRRLAELASRDQEFTLSIGFGCAPHRAEELLERVIAELAEVRASGFAEETVAKVREQQRRQREENLERNDFWVAALAGAYRLDLDPELMLEHERLVESVTGDSLRAAAERYLQTDQSVRAVLYPENGAAADEPAPEAG